MKKEWEQAVRRGDAGTLKRLLEDGHPIDSRNGHGQTALMIASQLGHTECVALLVGNGAELNHTAKYRLSALMLAVLNNHSSIGEILCDAGADPQIRGTGAPGFADKTAFDLAEGA